MKLRYVELPTERIFNWLDPFNVTAKWACKSITGDWWSEQNVAIRRYFADAWTEEFDKLTGHFTKLEKSIKEEGIRTPILTLSGPPLGKYVKPFHYRPEEQDDLSRVIRTNMFGGSRLTLARKLGIDKIACAVEDNANLFSNEPEITARNYRQWFGNEYAMSGNQLRAKSMSSHIKQVQTSAADIARTKTYAKFNLKGNI